jgi:hypothetical protein
VRVPTRIAALLGVVVLAVIAVCIFLIVGFFRGPDRGEYLRKNERIVNALPLPHGARETLRQSLRDTATVFGEQLEHTIGYTTYVTYAVGDGLTSKDIVRFYGRRLVGWRSSRWRVDGTWLACFDREGTTVSVQPEGLDSIGRTYPKTYGLAVNHDGGSCE